MKHLFYLIAFLTMLPATASEFVTIDSTTGAVKNNPALFNGNNMVLKLNSSGQLPAIDGSALTGVIPAWPITSPGGEIQIGFGGGTAVSIRLDGSAVFVAGLVQFHDTGEVSASDFIVGSNSFNSVFNGLGGYTQRALGDSLGNQIDTFYAAKATTLAGYGITDAQPLDSDLTAIAALTTTSFGRSLLTGADAAATRTTLGLGSVENTALSTWVGSTNLTTLGTIATGMWHGTAIGGIYLANPSASTLGGVQSLAAVSHQFMTSISTSGVGTLAQPVAGDVSGLGALATVTPGTGVASAAANAVNAASGLLVSGGSQNIPDANTALTVTGNSILIPTATPTAARVLTLPAASTVAKGCAIFLVDTGGFFVNGTGNGDAQGYTLTRAGSDTINGGTTLYVPPGKYSYALLFSDGVSAWVLPTPNTARVTSGGSQGGHFRPTICAPNDPSTGFGYGDGTSNTPLNFFSNGNANNASVTSNGFAGVYAATYASTGTYPNGGLGNGTDTSGFRMVSGDNNGPVYTFTGTDRYARFIGAGYAKISFLCPSTASANATVVIGDPVTTAATTKLGVGKVPSITGCDVTGVVQTDTNFNSTGAGTNTFTGSIQVGGGTVLTKFLSATASLSFGAILTLAESTQTITVTGATASANPSVELGWSAALPLGCVVKQTWVSADNTVSVTVLNTTIGTITPSAVTCRATVEQF